MCCSETSKIYTGDLKRGCDPDDDSDSEDEHELYISSISKKAMVEVRRAGAVRILRSASTKRFPPTEMIDAGNVLDGTYKRFDINQKVATILNDFELPKTGKARHLYIYKDTCEIEHLHGHISYTSFIKWQRFEYHAARKGHPTFWEIGYVGELNGFPYYSTKENARRSVALRILVDFFAYKAETNRSAPKNHYWPESIMSKTSKTDENFVVLVENRGARHHDDHLFCILLKHGPRYTLLIPRINDHTPWKEVEFLATNWIKKRGPNA
jgi:hypothetical protein